MPELNSPIFSGDVSGTVHDTSVDKLKGRAVGDTQPSAGQTLVWTGSSWEPSSSNAGGATGLTYYFNYDIPATNGVPLGLPGIPKLLGRTGSTVASSVTANLTANEWNTVAIFLTASSDPGASVVPAGLWDFNVWAFGNANVNSPIKIRAEIYVYGNSNPPTILTTSSEQVIGNQSGLVNLSALFAETPIPLGFQIYIQLQAFTTANSHSVTFEFGATKPSHLHTSFGLVAGTGLWKNVDGQVQSPASLLVDADVAGNANIAQSKILGLTAALANVPTPGAYIEFFEHFMGTTPLDGNLAFGSTGGTNATQNSGYGIVAMSTGAVASANQQARLVQAGTSALIGNAAVRVIFRAGQSGAGWFDGTLTGAARFGWGDSVTADSANGIYFRVQNGQGIDFVTKTGNVETLTSTGVSFAANVFRAMEILINAAGNQVVAKIDGVTVATHTTNIPTARVNFFAHINRTAAIATSVAMNLDFIYSRVTPNTPYF